MQKCPFTQKCPSALNCKDCYFHVTEPQTFATYCAITLAAERASNNSAILTKAFPHLSEQ